MADRKRLLRCRLSMALVAALMTYACTAPAPGAFHYDVDSCDYCRMTIGDARFAAQLVTRTGKIYRFDDPGCVVRFVITNRVADADVHSIWFNDHEHPDTRLNARAAVFVVSERIKAPMNGGMAAFGSPAAAAPLQTALGGLLRSWSEILAKRSS
jgi:copper chaperone NosL